MCPPVNIDEGEHLMLNGIPFGSTRRIMTNSNTEVCRISKLLQAVFPQSVMVAITGTTVGKKQDACCLFIFLSPCLLPPVEQ